MKTRKVVTLKIVSDSEETDQIINFLEIHMRPAKAKAWMNDNHVIVAMSNYHWLIPAVDHLPMKGLTYKLVKLDTESSHKKCLIYFNKHMEKIDKVRVWMSHESVPFIFFPEYNTWLLPVIDHTGYIR